MLQRLCKVNWLSIDTNLKVDFRCSQLHFSCQKLCSCGIWHEPDLDIRFTCTRARDSDKAMHICILNGIISRCFNQSWCRNRRPSGVTGLNDLSHVFLKDLLGITCRQFKGLVKTLLHMGKNPESHYRCNCLSNTCHGQSKVVSNLEIRMAPHKNPHFKRVEIPGMLHDHVHMSLACTQGDENSNQAPLSKSGLWECCTASTGTGVQLIASTMQECRQLFIGADEGSVNPTCSILIVLGQFIQIQGQLFLIELMPKLKFRDQIFDDPNWRFRGEVLHVTHRNHWCGENCNPPVSSTTPNIAKLQDCLCQTVPSGNAKLAQHLLGLWVPKDFWGTFQNHYSSLKQPSYLQWFGQGLRPWVLHAQSVTKHRVRPTGDAWTNNPVENTKSKQLLQDTRVHQITATKGGPRVWIFEKGLPQGILVNPCLDRKTKAPCSDCKPPRPEQRSTTWNSADRSHVGTGMTKDEASTDSCNGCSDVTSKSSPTIALAWGMSPETQIRSPRRSWDCIRCLVPWASKHTMHITSESLCPLVRWSQSMKQPSEVNPKGSVCTAPLSGKALDQSFWKILVSWADYSQYMEK